MDATTWDQTADKWYFTAGGEQPIARTINLDRARAVSIDVDYYGRIIGVGVV